MPLVTPLGTKRVGSHVSVVTDLQTGKEMQLAPHPLFPLAGILGLLLLAVPEHWGTVHLAPVLMSTAQIVVVLSAD